MIVGRAGAALKAPAVGLALRPLQLGGLRPNPGFIQHAAARPSIKRCAKPEDQPDVKPVDAEWVKEVATELVDSKELGQRGEAWFAAQLVGLLLVAFPPGGLRPLLEVAGVAAILAGLALAVAGQQALGSNLTPLPKPREQGSLITSGIYAECRHPMYGGLVLASVGLSLALSDDLRLAFAALAFFILDRKAAYEEELLEEKYGEQYKQYKERTKKLLPRIY